MPVYAFWPKQKPSAQNPSFNPILSIGLRSCFRETVHREKRETGLEPATACLEENLPQELFGNSLIGSNGRSRAFSWYASSPDKSACRAKYKSFCYLKAISTRVTFSSILAFNEKASNSLQKQAEHPNPLFPGQSPDTFRLHLIMPCAFLAFT